MAARRAVSLLTDDLGRWDPLAIDDVVALLAPATAPWWISGGWALDLFAGHQTRQHHDVDVGLLRRDQAVLHEVLPTWDLHCADPPGTLRPWPVGEWLDLRVHDIWARPTPTSPWQLQFMFNEADGDDWVFRRDPSIRRPLVEVIRHTSDGVPYLAPEVQLLFKAARKRERDVADWDVMVPLLDDSAREWLAERC